MSHECTTPLRQNANQWYGKKKPHQLEKNFNKSHRLEKFSLTVFWDCEEILLEEYCLPGEIINVARHWDTSMKLHRAIQNKRQGKLSSGIALFCNNARPHTADLNVRLLNSFNWEVFEQPHIYPTSRHLIFISFPV